MPAPPSSANTLRRLVQLCAILGGGLACFLFGRLTAPTSPVSRETIPPTTANVSATSSTVGTAARPKPIAATPVSASGGWDDATWDGFQAAPSNPARSDALCALLEKLAILDPARAMAMAASEPNLKLRAQLLNAALGGWAQTDPAKALEWAQTQTTTDERENAMSLVFQKALLTNPEAAESMGLAMLQNSPAGSIDAKNRGTLFFQALCTAGRFESAVRMASDLKAPEATIWLRDSVSQWASYQPQQALAAVQSMTEPAQKTEALQGLIHGWAAADPAACTRFAADLPAMEAKESLLIQSLTQWAQIDPENASDWMNSRPPSPELDSGMAMIATTPGAKPEIAIRWAEDIGSESLRSETVLNVLREWIRTDISAATKYAQSTRFLQEGDRREITALLEEQNRNHNSQAH